MSQPVKQHLIDPEICIRCYTCETMCPAEAIEHDGVNVVVDAAKCNFCMDCIAPCPTGSIDHWRVVQTPYSLSDQYGWGELPAQETFADAASTDSGPIEALDAEGKPFLPRLYSVSSPRDGERPNFNNLSLTVKREPNGVCSNYVCDLKKGDKVRLTGPFGATFLMPNDPKARLLMICTGTGSAPFRAFTMRRQRNGADESASMTLVFGARTPDSLPYFGPLNKVPDTVLKKHLVFSRAEGRPKRYVQDKLREEEEAIADLVADPNAYIYVCGLRAMEKGVEEALGGITESRGLQWRALRDAMREEGRYHIETY